MPNTEITTTIYELTNQSISYIPVLVSIIILILLGWILGKYIGKIGSKVLDKIGLDDLIDSTSLGDVVKKAGFTTVGLFEAIIRWFIYLIFAAIIIDMLNIQVVADFITQLVVYIPLIISAIVILIIGLLLVDFIAELTRKILFATGVDDKISQSSIGKPLKEGGITASGIIAGIIKLFGYLIFIMAATEILKFTIITNFLKSVVNYLPHLFTGVLILILGFLAIDFVIDYIQATMKGMEVEGSDIWLPVLRGFLFLIVVLLSLDAMLINTNIFYIFLQPLAWGFAIVIAFKWGIKEALVAYAKAKNKE